TGCSAKSGRFASVHPFDEHPGHGCGTGCNVRNHKGRSRKRTRAHRAARVEPEPSKPQQTGPQYCQCKVMRSHNFNLVSLSFSQDQCAGERSNTGAYMNHKTSGEIKCPHLFEPAAGSPYPVSERIIYKGCPKNQKHEVGTELEPFSNGP